jgi:type IV pilus assembly protein PilW
VNRVTGCIGLSAGRRGFTLLELLLALTLSFLLVVGLIRIVSASSASARLQDNHAQLQENARLAISRMTAAVRQAGFRPKPWEDSLTLPPLGDANLNGSSSAGDQLSLLAWSDRNCFDNLNPVRDENDDPQFYIRESTFSVKSSRNLAFRCRYGPSLTELSVEIRREGFVPGVESLQVLFGEDSDQDGNVNRWVHAGQWDDPARVLGVRFGLLLASTDAVTDKRARDYRVLDARLRKNADGRLRSVVEMAAAFRGRK